MLGIRHVNLKQSEMQELQVIMSTGNVLLKECADMMNMSNGEFRGKLFNGKLDTSNLSPEQLQKIVDAKPAIFAVRNQCEQKIINAFAKLVYKQAKAAANNSNDPRNAFYEFEQVGTLAILDSIYGYTDVKILFMTYAWRSVRRRINLTVNRLSPFCPLTNEAMTLLQNFDEVKLKLNRPTNTEEVVSAMGLTDEQKDVLFSATTKMLNQQHERDNIESDGDYTASRRGIDNDLKEVNGIRKDARQAVKDADLTEIELQVILADMFPYHGWREDVASRFINPRSNKRYTRANIVNIMERAKKKVGEAYLKPLSEPKENPIVDAIFDEMSGHLAS